MLRDPVSNPIKWLMVISALVLTIFLYKFTADSFSYIDNVEAQAFEDEL